MAVAAIGVQSYNYPTELQFQMGLFSEYGLLVLVVVWNKLFVELPRHWLTKAMQNNSISLSSLEWVTSSIEMDQTGGRRLERKFASLRRKEWQRKCCNLDCVDSCWDIPDSPRCCLQLVSNLERKWKWKENDIKMAIAPATYSCQFSCSVLRTAEIVDNPPHLCL